MKLYKEEASQQGSPKRQKDPSVAAWPWSSLCHQRHMCRAAEGLFQRVVHLTLLEHPMASLRFSGDKRRCLTQIPIILFIFHMYIFTLAHKVSTCSASWGEAALIPSLHTKSYLVKPKDMAKPSACLLLVPAKQEKTTGSDLDGIFWLYCSLNSIGSICRASINSPTGKYRKQGIVYSPSTDRFTLQDFQFLWRKSSAPLHASSFLAPFLFAQSPPLDRSLDHSSQEEHGTPDACT